MQVSIVACATSFEKEAALALAAFTQQHSSDQALATSTSNTSGSSTSNSASSSSLSSVGIRSTTTTVTMLTKEERLQASFDQHVGRLKPKHAPSPAPVRTRSPTKTRPATAPARRPATPVAPPQQLPDLALVVAELETASDSASTALAAARRRAAPLAPTADSRIPAPRPTPPHPDGKPVSWPLPHGWRFQFAKPLAHPRDAETNGNSHVPTFAPPGLLDDVIYESPLREENDAVDTPLERDAQHNDEPQAHATPSRSEPVTMRTIQEMMRQHIATFSARAEEEEFDDDDDVDVDDESAYNTSHDDPCLDTGEGLDSVRAKILATAAKFDLPLTAREFINDDHVWEEEEEGPSEALEMELQLACELEPELVHELELELEQELVREMRRLRQTMRPPFDNTATLTEPYESIWDDQACDDWMQSQELETGYYFHPNNEAIDANRGLDQSNPLHESATTPLPRDAEEELEESFRKLKLESKKLRDSLWNDQQAAVDSTAPKAPMHHRNGTHINDREPCCDERLERKLRQAESTQYRLHCRLVGFHARVETAIAEMQLDALEETTASYLPRDAADDELEESFRKLKLEARKLRATFDQPSAVDTTNTSSSASAHDRIGTRTRTRTDDDQFFDERLERQFVQAESAQYQLCFRLVGFNAAVGIATNQLKRDLIQEHIQRDQQYRHDEQRGPSPRFSDQFGWEAEETGASRLGTCLQAPPCCAH